jgi:hypothetical protein
MKEEIDARGPKFAKRCHKVLEAPAEAVHGPGREDVELASNGVPEHAVELGPLVSALGAGDALVFVDGSGHDRNEGGRPGQI